MTVTRPVAIALLLLASVGGSACLGGYCEHEKLETRGCGLNHRGTQLRTCTHGMWSEPGACRDPDVCVDGAAAPSGPAPCGLNGRGTVTGQTCAQGQWKLVCDDPDVCTDGGLDHASCGVLGNQSRQCTAGQWGPYGACDDPESITIEVPGRQDMVYDTVRRRLYITTGDPANQDDLTGKVLVFDFAKRELAGSIRHGSTFLGIDLSPDGNWLLIADGRGWIQQFDVNESTYRWIGVPPAGTQAFSVAITSNSEALVSSRSSGSGGGRLFRVIWNLPTPMEPAQIETIATGRQDALLAPSAGGSVVAFAQPNGSGEWGRYDASTRTFTSSTMGRPAYEIAVDRSASQYAVPTPDGLDIFDSTFQLRAVLGQSTGQVPIGVAYSPVADELYVTWAGNAGAAIDVYSSITLEKLRDIEPAPGLFSPVSRPFVEGRTRVSRDGLLLFVTRGSTIVAYRTGR